MILPCALQNFFASQIFLIAVSEGSISSFKSSLVSEILPLTFLIMFLIVKTKPDKTTPLNKIFTLSVVMFLSFII